MILLDASSPNFDSRKGAPISMLVMHYTGMRNQEEAINRLRDPSAKVSAHYVIGETGAVFQLVEESERAWHAGKSYWRGITDVNAHSIGIELVNPGHEFGYRPFPPAQMKALKALVQEILERHPGIERRNVIAHSDVAPERKQDPGELFDWKKLANAGIGLWPEEPEKISQYVPDMGETQRKLKLYGYNIQLTGEEDGQTRKVITAFQRHFRPGNFTGTWDGECDALLMNLLVGLA